MTEILRRENGFAEAMRWLEAMSRASTDLALTKDANLRYTWVSNPRPPYSVEAILGKTDHDLVPEHEARRISEVERGVLETGAGTRVEIAYTLPGSETRYYEYTVEPLREPEGVVAGVAAYAHEITRRKVIQLENERLLAEQRRLLEDLTQANEQLALSSLRQTALAEEAQAREARLRRLEEYRHDYISMISHDLRTPLTSVMAYGQLLRRSLQEKGLEREAKHAEAVLTGAKRMNDMINDLLETTRAENGELDLQVEPVNLADLVSSLLARVEDTFQRGRVRLVWVGTQRQVPADPGRIERVVENLVSNALKYSPSDSQVTVRVETGSDFVQLSVVDKGHGIPVEDLPHVFDRFYRSRSIARKREGLGLGLYISRLIVEAHGGRIWAESEVGKGSSFHVWLPAANS